MRRLAATLAALLATTACTTMEMPPMAQQQRNNDAMVSPILTTPEAVDNQTYAQPQVARVTHVALDLALDFETQTVGGTAVLDIMAEPDADQIVLDDKGLRIVRITDGRGRALPYEVGAPRAGGERGHGRAAYHSDR